MPTRPLITDDDASIETVARAERKLRPSVGLRATVVGGPGAGAASSLRQATSILGRSPAADVRLADPMVSAFHAEVSAAPEGVRVRDLDSRNGTFYQGARLAAAVVPSGSVLVLGESAVRLDVDAPLEVPAVELASFGELRGAAASSRELFALLARLARTELAVLLEGPTGVGKELAARALHDESAHAGGPFVVLDCTAIPAALAESILFGHERGAFTGATERRPGVFEAAEDGTIFLDEVGELPLELQPKLLRVLERREAVRVGSNRPLPVRARVISATWRDLRARINQGAFREDLYYRLAQARVTIPPLADRPEDIPLLVQHFLRALPAGAPGARSIAPDALDALARRDFPGNVRELRNTVERVAMMAAGDVVTSTDLAVERLLAGEQRRGARPHAASDAPEGQAPIEPFKAAKQTLVEDFEREYLTRLFARTGQNLSRASALAGIERHHLRDLARKHGLLGSG